MSYSKQIIGLLSLVSGQNSKIKRSCYVAHLYTGREKGDWQRLAAGVRKFEDFLELVKHHFGTQLLARNELWVTSIRSNRATGIASDKRRTRNMKAQETGYQLGLPGDEKCAHA